MAPGWHAVPTCEVCSVRTETARNVRDWPKTTHWTRNTERRTTCCTAHHATSRSRRNASAPINSRCWLRPSTEQRGNSRDRLHPTRLLRFHRRRLLQRLWSTRACTHGVSGGCDWDRG